MRAGIFRELNVVEAADVDDPEVGGADALIEVAACGVCGSDLESWRHGSNPARPLVPAPSARH